MRVNARGGMDRHLQLERVESVQVGQPQNDKKVMTICETHSCLMASANSGVNLLQVATSLLRSYVPASYVE